MKKKVLSILVAAVMVMSLGACSLVKTSDDSAGGSSDTKEKKDGTLKVGYTVQSMENAYFVSIVEGMKAAAKEKGIDLVVADAAADASKHISQIEDFVSQGVDAIIISPVDQEAPADAVKKAQEAGIPVISLDQEVKGSDAFFGIDEEEYGRLGGELAGQWLNEKEGDGTIDDIANDKGEIEVVVVRYDQIPSVIKTCRRLKTRAGRHLYRRQEDQLCLRADAADADTGYNLSENSLNVQSGCLNVHLHQRFLRAGRIRILSHT